VSPTGVLFSYAIGLIFAVGGLLFLIFLEDNRFLFGVPYLLMGLAIVYGVRASQRRTARRAQAEREGAEPPPRRGH
jgi:hypothetical protein